MQTLSIYDKNLIYNGLLKHFIIIICFCGLVLMNVSAYYQQIITGLIIVLAVAFDTYAKSRRGAL